MFLLSYNLKRTLTFVVFSLAMLSAIVLNAQDSTNSQKQVDSIPGLLEYQAKNASNGPSKQSPDLRDVMQQTDRYFQKYPEKKEAMEETYKNYQRWKYYWQPRMSKVGQKKASTDYAIEMARKRLHQSTNKKQKKPTEVCDWSNHNSDWQFLGPKKKYSGQNRGRLISVAIHPEDTNTIYAGSYHSGLYKTTDHGEHWGNVTQSIRVPGLGVHDIAIDPKDSKTI